jgi:hypothetical protein
VLACFGAITAPLAVAAGAAAWLLGRHDLNRIRQGLMDPAGHHYTEVGRAVGLWGAALGLFFGVAFLLMLTPGAIASGIAVLLMAVLGLCALLR